MSETRVLVVGGGGFIGSHLAAYHHAKGHRVDVLVRWGTSLERLDALDIAVNVHRARLTDRSEVDSCVQSARPDIVYFLASGDHRNPRPELADALDSVGEDLTGLLTLLAALVAHPPRIFVRTGSLAEYGSAPAPYIESCREEPTSSHGACLVAGTHYLAVLGSRLPFAVSTARMALVYGPSQSRRFLVPALIGHCLEGVPLTLERPNDRRDLLHVDDAVRGLALLTENAMPPPLVNIATGIAPTVREIAQIIVEASGCDPGLVKTSSAPVTGGMTDFRGATEVATHALGFRAETGYADGLVAEVARQLQRAPALVSY